MTSSALVRFAPRELPVHSEEVGMRLERRALGDRAVVLALPAGRHDESTHARYVCEMTLRRPEGVVVGPGQLLITPHRVLGFVSSGPLGSLLEGGRAAVYGFSIDRQTLEQFHVEVNWRNRAIALRFQPAKGVGSAVVLEISATTLALAADGTTTAASLDSVVKSFDKINWTTVPAGEKRTASAESQLEPKPKPTPTHPSPSQTPGARSSSNRPLAPPATPWRGSKVASPPRAPSGTCDFRLLRVQRSGDDDGLLYPIPADGSSRIRLDSSDGSAMVLAADGLALNRFAGGVSHRLADYLHRRVDVIITDARLAVVCVEWNKGHRARNTGIIRVAGSELDHALENQARKLKESYDRKGAVLLGHARYAWVTGVCFGGFQTKRSLQQLRIDVRRIESDELHLSVYFDRKVDVPALARQIVSRVAAFRLENTRQDEHTREILASAAAGPPILTPTREKLARYPIPGYCGASPETAVPAST